MVIRWRRGGVETLGMKAAQDAVHGGEDMREAGDEGAEKAGAVQVAADEEDMMGDGIESVVFEF